MTEVIKNLFIEIWWIWKFNNCQFKKYSISIHVIYYFVKEYENERKDKSKNVWSNYKKSYRKNSKILKNGRVILKNISIL